MFVQILPIYFIICEVRRLHDKCLQWHGHWSRLSILLILVCFKGKTIRTSIGYTDVSKSFSNFFVVVVPPIVSLFHSLIPNNRYSSNLNDYRISESSLDLEYWCFFVAITKYRLHVFLLKKNLIFLSCCEKLPYLSLMASNGSK